VVHVLHRLRSEHLPQDPGCAVEARRPPPRLRLAVPLTFLPGGSIEAQQTLVARPGADFSGVVVTTSGAVTRATGIYLGDTGRVAGAGTLAVDPDGTVHPDLTFRIALG